MAKFSVRRMKYKPANWDTNNLILERASFESSKVIILTPRYIIAWKYIIFIN